jgi:hypothetical protein
MPAGRIIMMQPAAYLLAIVNREKLRRSAAANAQAVL